MLKNQIEDLKLSTTELNGFFRGVVEDNNDPLKMGRLRIRVFGLHTDSKTKTQTDGIETSELPWAEPILGIIEGSISGNGLWSVPVQGSHVMVFFENGNYSQPRYFGTIPGIVSALPDTTKGFNDPDGSYPSRTGTDYPSEATGNNYPDVMVLKTRGGVIMEIDNVSKFIKVTHPSGTIINMDNSGNKTETITGNKTNTISGNKTNTISGDKTDNTTGDHSMSMANLTINASGTITITGTSVTINADTEIAGIITGSGGGGGTLDGQFEVSGGDIIADGVSLKTHTHDGGPPPD